MCFLLLLFFFGFLVGTEKEENVADASAQVARFGKYSHLTKAKTAAANPILMATATPTFSLANRTANRIFQGSNAKHTSSTPEKALTEMATYTCTQGSQQFPSTIVGVHAFWMGEQLTHQNSAAKPKNKLQRIIAVQRNVLIHRPSETRSNVTAKETLLHDDAMMENVTETRLIRAIRVIVLVMGIPGSGRG